MSDTGWYLCGLGVRMPAVIQRHDGGQLVRVRFHEISNTVHDTPTLCGNIECVSCTETRETEIHGWCKKRSKRPQSEIA